VRFWVYFIEIEVTKELEMKKLVVFLADDIGCVEIENGVSN
jgi:hypothetical protein